MVFSFNVVGSKSAAFLHCFSKQLFGSGLENFVLMLSAGCGCADFTGTMKFFRLVLVTRNVFMFLQRVCMYLVNTRAGMSCCFSMQTKIVQSLKDRGGNEVAFLFLRGWLSKELLTVVISLSDNCQILQPKHLDRRGCRNSTGKLLRLQTREQSLKQTINSSQVRKKAHTNAPTTWRPNDQQNVHLNMKTENVNKGKRRSSGTVSNGKALHESGYFCQTA